MTSVAPALERAAPEFVDEGVPGGEDRLARRRRMEVRRPLHAAVRRVHDDRDGRRRGLVHDKRRARGCHCGKCSRPGGCLQRPLGALSAGAAESRSRRAPSTTDPSRRARRTPRIPLGFAITTLIGTVQRPSLHFPVGRRLGLEGQCDTVRRLVRQQRLQEHPVRALWNQVWS